MYSINKDSSVSVRTYRSYSKKNCILNQKILLCMFTFHNPVSNVLLLILFFVASPTGSCFFQSVIVVLVVVLDDAQLPPELLHVVDYLGNLKETFLFIYF